MLAKQSKPWMTQKTKMTKITPQAHQNMHKSFTKLSQNHAKNKAQSTKHVTTKFMALQDKYGQHAWCV